VDGSKIVALRNGVDLQMFTPPTDRSALKKSLSIQDPSILSVGHLIERKGHHIVIEALAHLPDHHLYIAGDGPERNALQKLTHDMALEARVHFLGEIPHNCLKDYYGAVDAMILASSREGWANVLLESMACGTPVVATAVWGTAEVVRSPQAGILCKERNATMIAQSVRQLFANYPDRPKTRSYAEGFDWEETTVGQLELFTKILQR
jgi:glycosyltransferase involved in cell wall biosynthesis